MISGNLTGRSLLGRQGETESLTFETQRCERRAHAVTSSAWGAYGYDGKVNQTSSPEERCYTSSIAEEHRRETDTTTFAYDARARVLKKSAGIIVSTVYAGGLYERPTVAEFEHTRLHLNVAGRQIGQILRKERPKRDGLYIPWDTLGSSEVVTDASGQLGWQHRKYDPFGGPTDITFPKPSRSLPS